jgi:hypothetical protein
VWSFDPTAIFTTSFADSSSFTASCPPVAAAAPAAEASLADWLLLLQLPINSDKAMSEMLNIFFITVILGK